jgi:2-haloacid dehalogenase
MAIHAVIFDLGGVLIDWNPRYFFDDHYFASEKDRQFFFDKVCTAEWNENQDAGHPLAKATNEKIAEFPDWEKAIRDYYGRWEEMLKAEIPESVAIFKKLKENRSLKLYALTNWSAETFPIALKRFDFLHWFDGRVVSGEENNRKPFPEFYQLLLDRYHLQASEALFIDDSLRNVKAASELGIKSIQFISPAQLKKDLEDLGLFL